VDIKSGTSDEWLGRWAITLRNVITIDGTVIPYGSTVFVDHTSTTNEGFDEVFIEWRCGDDNLQAKLSIKDIRSTLRRVRTP
jgi:hypothetical protein